MSDALFGVVSWVSEALFTVLGFSIVVAFMFLIWFVILAIFGLRAKRLVVVSAILGTLAALIFTTDWCMNMLFFPH